MGNWKRAYSWFGWILAQKDYEKPAPNDNVVFVEDEKLRRLKNDCCECELPEGVFVERLGITCSEESDEFFILAVGAYFKEGFKWYGTAVDEIAEDERLATITRTCEVLKDHYGIELDPSTARLMVGCSSEM
jgi:hypothetical protein